MCAVIVAMKLDIKISLSELARHIAKMTTMICSHQDVLIAMDRLKMLVYNVVHALRKMFATWRSG